MARILRWAPTALLAIGAIFTLGIDFHRAMPLRAPLDSAIPARIGGQTSRDLVLSEAELRIAGVSDYLMRAYTPIDSASSATGFSLFVGYYEEQSQGQTIHSPKNCLPGSGWKVLASRTAPIETPAGRQTVNRYLLQREGESALVLYWYQGRGRVQASEYAVKWNLLRDAALRGRSEEALVRIVTPIVQSEETAFEQAAAVAGLVMAAIANVLPD